MIKKRAAIISTEFIREVAIAVESENGDDYDLKCLIQWFCSSAKTDHGAQPELQQLIAVLLEGAMLKGNKFDELFNLKSKRMRGRPNLKELSASATQADSDFYLDRAKTVCTYIAEEIAIGHSLGEAIKNAADKFKSQFGPRFGQSRIKDVWGDFKVFGFFCYQSARTELGNPLNDEERKRLAEYCNPQKRGRPKKG